MLLLLLLVVTVFCVLLFRLVSCVTCSFFCADFLNKHCILNNVSFHFSIVLFSRCLFFYDKIYMLLLLLLVVTVFCVLLFRLVSCVTCFFLRCFFVLASHWSQPGGVYFVYSIFALFECFLAGLLCFFLVWCFLAVAIRDKYRRPGPCEHPATCFLCLPPHIKLTDSAHPHHSWAYMHL